MRNKPWIDRAPDGWIDPSDYGPENPMPDSPMVAKVVSYYDAGGVLHVVPAAEYFGNEIIGYVTRDGVYFTGNVKPVEMPESEIREAK